MMIKQKNNKEKRSKLGLFKRKEKPKKKQDNNEDEQFYEDMEMGVFDDD